MENRGKRCRSNAPLHVRGGAAGRRRPRRRDLLLMMTTSSDLSTLLCLFSVVDGGTTARGQVPRWRRHPRRPQHAEPPRRCRRTGREVGNGRGAAEGQQAKRQDDGGGGQHDADEACRRAGHAFVHHDGVVQPDGGDQQQAEQAEQGRGLPEQAQASQGACRGRQRHGEQPPRWPTVPASAIAARRPPHRTAVSAPPRGCARLREEFRSTGRCGRQRTRRPGLRGGRRRPPVSCRAPAAPPSRPPGRDPLPATACGGSGPADPFQHLVHRRWIPARPGLRPVAARPGRGCRRFRAEGVRPGAPVGVAQRGRAGRAGALRVLQAGSAIDSCPATWP